MQIINHNMWRVNCIHLLKSTGNGAPVVCLALAQPATGGTTPNYGGRRRRHPIDIHRIIDIERLTDDIHARKYRNKFMIFILHALRKTSLNIRHDPYSLEKKYVILMILTLNDTLLPAVLYNSPHLLMYLELSLAPGGSPPLTHNIMKIMLWNYR